jgi:hypothetical protein
MWASSGSSDHGGFHSGTARPNFSQSLLDLAGKSLTDLVVVTELELQPPIYLILRRSRPPEDCIVRMYHLANVVWASS